MARELWLLRHAEAEPHGTRRDEERRLTERGEEQAQWAGAALRALGIEPERVWSSPKVRARMTADIAAGSERVEEHEWLASRFDGSAALELAAELSADGKALLVGHNPDFERVVADLTGARVDVKKGGVAVIALEGGHGGNGELIALMRPRELRRIGE